MPKWYQLSAAETFAKLGTDDAGLTSAEARARLEKYGYNELKLKGPNILLTFLRQFNNPLVYILLVAILLTAILEMWMDMSVIAGVVLLNVIIGFFQEGKAESALEALRKLIVLESTVVRDGRQQVIPARELVPGDVVSLDAGSKIPADLRLFFTKDAAADESALTGESIPVEKNIETIAEPGLSPGDQRCIAFSGTFITRGSARGIVIGTGEQTEFGKIAKLVKETRTVMTPLQRKITDFTRVLIIAILIIGGINFLVGHLVGYDLVYNFLGSVSLVVAAVPEMLPMIVTGILALAATAMVHRHALIRRLPAAETLGTTTVICSDKTGTLTKNEMTVVKVYSGGNTYGVSGVGYEPRGQFTRRGEVIIPARDSKTLVETLKAGLLCSNASLAKNEDRYHIVGDPTEGALMVSAAKAGIIQNWRRLDEIPFDSKQMYMATLYEGEGQNIIYAKGSPETILAMCHDQLGDDGVEPLDGREIMQQADEMAKEALRLLGMAYKIVPREHTSLGAGDMQGLTFLGLQGMIDPPRQEAIEAVRKCKTAGIRSVMITGDHLLTAEAIARQLGIMSDGGDGALAGKELEAMSDQELYEAVGRTSVYARVAPEHKLRIAQQLQRRGHIVAMTGDGINDAPALKAADIGIAMGITGTEVTKEASSMVLTDDNFASIVGAVEEGRHAWNNLEKAILYTLPTNAGQALLVIGAIMLAPFIPIFAARLPLDPIHILWVNLFDSVFLTMPLMFEPKDKDLLKIPPRSPKAKIANLLFLERNVLIGVVIATTGFVIYNYFGAAAVSAEGVILDPLLLTQAQTAAFWAVVMVHLGFVASARSVFKSAFSFSPFSNKWLLWGMAITLGARFIITFSAGLQDVFRIAGFPVEWWLLIIPCLLPGFIALELDKLIRKWFRERNITSRGTTAAGI